MTTLIDAVLTWTNLAGADLRGARLHNANLHGANLKMAGLKEAMLDGTILSEVNLTQSIGLEECEHFGPSVIDHRTIQKSERLPLTFLRGCGLPDSLIDYFKSNLNPPIQYHSLFISHSSHDKAFVKRLYDDLQEKGIRCWFAPHDLPIGAKTLDEIDKAIRESGMLLLILSQNSIASDWVEDEVNKAFAEERRRQQEVVFPVRVDDTILQTSEAWAVKLRDARNIGDFTRWTEHNAYQTSFNKLVRDLRMKPTPP